MQYTMQILNFTKPDLFFLNLKVDHKFDLFQKMFEKLHERGFVKESFITGIIEREKNYPTGLQLSDYGCAVPHTDIEHVIIPTIAIATLNQPIEFHAMGDPKSKVNVNVVFMLALNKEQDQVQMLKELALMIQNQDVMKKIMVAKTNSEILEIIRNVSI